MASTEKEMLEGFNAGYIIQQHHPALAQKLVAGIEAVNLPFFDGFKAGSNEFAKERKLTVLKGLFKDRPNFPSNRNSKGEKGMDGPEI